MKALPNGAGGAAWDNRWVNDIGFIRKHLRYPINRLTVLPVLMAAMGLASTLLLLYLALTWQAQSRHRNPAPLIGIAAMSLTGLVAGYRHLQLLRFIPVPTPHFSADNQQLLLRFFRSEQLAHARHPEVPEVFQIISKPIQPGKEDREVMIFLADDRRILINSHFTGNGWTARAGHQKEMAQKLRKWVASHPEQPGTNLTPIR